MSASSVRDAIFGQLDRFAKGRQLSQQNWDGGTNFWDRADAPQDAAYENLANIQALTDLDTALAEGRLNHRTITQWFTIHAAYAVAVGYDNFKAYVAGVGMRIPHDANEVCFDALGSRFTPTSVFPKGTLPTDGADPASSGMHLLGTYESGALAAGDGALPSTVGPAALMCVNLGAAATVGATLTCTNWVAATSKDIAFSLSGADQYTQTILGEQALSSGVSAGDVGLPVASTAAFTAGEYALVWESDTLQEVVLISSLGTGPTRLVVPALKNAYTTSAKVWPLFRSVTYKSGASGSGVVAVYARPDRIIAL